MFDFSQLFTPERMAQAQQGVQGVNQMPWVFHNYLAQLLGLGGNATPATPTPTPAPAQTSPLATLLSIANSGNPEGDQNAAWYNILQNPGGGA